VSALALRLVIEENIAVASVDYRLTSEAGQYGGEPVIFPAQIHDVKGAVRWLKAHAASYGLDPDRFGGLGIIGRGAPRGASPARRPALRGSRGWSAGTSINRARSRCLPITSVPPIS